MIRILNFKDFNSLNESIRIEKIDPSYYSNETVTSLPYSKYIKENRNSFLKKLVKISEDLGIKPIWLLHTIFNESRFDPKKADKYTGAVGLLSFFPEVLKNLIHVDTGKIITPNDVLQMSNVDQLDLINGFYKNWIEAMELKSPVNPGDFAALTFYPGVIKKDWKWEFPDYVVQKNSEMFKKFPNPGGKTKKDYYDYINQKFEYDGEYDDNNEKILGKFTGAFVDPSLFRSKKPLEYYKDLILTKEDPALNAQVQAQDAEVTQTNKQVEK
jgi:hypothetical protein